jgi:hypothetical protein
MGSGAGIEIDGPRPAVAWVTSLPREYGMTPAEKLVLLCLACDAFDWKSGPGYDVIAEWTGMHRSSCAEILGRLEKATAQRPALVAKMSLRGRRRTVWRLLGDGQPSGPTGRLNRPAPPDGSAPEPSGPTGRFADGSDVSNRPAPPDGSGANRRPTVGEPSGPAGHALCPNPSVVEKASYPPSGGVKTRATRAPAREASPDRGTRIPENWQPDPQLIEWTRKNAPDVGWVDVEKFRNHWLAKPGKDGRKIRWDLTWRNWAIEEQRRIDDRRQARAGRRSTTDDRVAAAQSLRAKYEALDQAEAAGLATVTHLAIGGNPA